MHQAGFTGFMAIRKRGKRKSFIIGLLFNPVQYHLDLHRRNLYLPYPPGIRRIAGYYHHWLSLCIAAFQTGRAGAGAFREGDCEQVGLSIVEVRQKIKEMSDKR